VAEATRSTPAHTLPPLNFTASEAAAIALALARSGPMPFDGAARTALHKVVAAMPATGRTSAADLLARIHLMHAKRELSDALVLRAVEEAVLERRVLCLGYCDKQGHSTEAQMWSRSVSSAPSVTGTWWGGVGFAAVCACSAWTGSAQLK
jgi:predicted DNA-binding transcriptional regulator YafY